MYYNRAIRFNISWFGLFLFCIKVWGQSASAPIHFEKIGIQDGLSQNTIEMIFQDSTGFMWFGTQDGLNRYDGYNFKVVVPYTVICMQERIRGQFFVGNRSPKGLTIYDERLGGEQNAYNLSLVSDIQVDVSNKNRLWLGAKGLQECTFSDGDTVFKEITGSTALEITQLYQSPKAPNVLWIGTARQGLWQYKIDKAKLEKLIDFSEKPSQNTVNQLYSQPSGELYAATNIGLFDVREGKPVSVFDNQFSGFQINSILKDTKGNLWVGTVQGLYVKREKQEVFRHFTEKSPEGQNISQNHVTRIIEDNSGIIWVGTYFGGLNKYNPNRYKFSSIRQDDENKNSLVNNVVRAIYQVSKDVFWIGTSKGLSLYNRENGTYRNFHAYPQHPDSLAGENVRAIYRDGKGRLWFCTNKGLHLLDEKQLSFKRYVHKPNDSTSIAFDYVTSMGSAPNGHLWIGTFGGGLDLFNPETGKFTHFYSKKPSPYTLSDPRIPAIYTANNGITWISAGKGLVKVVYEGKRPKFEHINPKITQATDVQSGFVKAYLEDNKGRFWLATSKHGFGLFNRATNEFKLYNTSNGLSNNTVYGILADQEGSLWMSTNKGLSRFYPETEQFENYDFTDGLQSNEFNTGAYGFAQHTGELMFGGVNGLNIFHPKNIKHSRFVPNLAFTDFQLYYKSVQPDPKGNSLLSKNIDFTDYIELSHEDQIISFEFASLHYANSEKNSFQYLLKGFDKEWVYAGSRHYITYTNLPAGNFELLVKASNSDGEWMEEPRSIHLKVNPALWNTWWFRALAVAIIVIAAVAWYKARTWRIKKQREILKQKVVERTQEISLQNAQLKQQKGEILAQSAHLEEANAEIFSQKEELLAQSSFLEEAYYELNEQKTVIEQSHKNIQDSIRYASRIQEAILLVEEDMKAHFQDDMFIVYRPKNVVSGDFYWYAKQGNKAVIAAVDCTGHGVPGAFMSLIGSNLLYQIVNIEKTLDAGKILNKLHRAIEGTLKQKKTNNKDGMDLSLVVIDEEKKEMQFAGARNSIIYFQNEQLHQIKGDRMSIGGMMQHEENRIFTSHLVNIDSPTSVYLFSDGYIDQFGGEKKRKFLMKNFKAELTRIQQKPFEEQKDALEQTLDHWMRVGKEQQIDDILVIGFYQA